MAARGNISDEAVQKATGKDWRAWFAILDKKKAKTMAHRDIVEWLFHTYLGKKGKSINVASSNGWWSQMVTVEYERARGLRKVNQNESGFLVAVHKTMAMPVKKLEKAWEKLSKSKSIASKKLERLPSKTKRRMIRYKASPGGLVVTFDERPHGKSRMMVEAIKLKNKTEVERERAFWKKAIEGLK